MSEQLQPMTFPLSGSRLIEASAGTGKTFTLALLYTRLVLGHNKNNAGFHRPLTPREILVVTFTDAAAEELRDRIRSRLVEAAEYFINLTASRSATDPLQQLRSDYPQAEWPACAWRLQLAAESMDEACVSTIHSWCNRMLVEYAFDTRGLFNRELVTDTSELLTQTLQDYWRVHFYPLDSQTAALITAEFKSPAALLRPLQNLLKSTSKGVSFQGQPLQVDDLTPHFAAWLEFHQAEQAAAADQAAARARQQEQEQAVRSHWLEHWSEIETHLKTLRPHLKATSHDSKTEESYQALLDQIHAWAKGEAERPGKLKNFAAGQFSFLAKASIQQEEPLPAFKRLGEWLNTSQPSAAKLQEPDIPLQTALLAHASQWVRKEFNKRMAQRAEMGFDDLLTQLEQALNPEVSGESALHLAEILRRSFPVAMIDEFQDTDPIQYAIFDHIYRINNNHPETGLFMIGDPKQAIYSFRGADIHTYLKAKTATQGRHFTLKKNFRSTHAVVDACNQLFLQAESHERGAFRFRTEADDPLPYVEVNAQGQEKQLYLHQQAVDAMNLWYFHASDEQDRYLGTEAYVQQAAAVTASQICAWLTAAQEGKAGFGQQGKIDQPLQPADIAILVRRGHEAKAVREELEKRGVASVYLSDRESVFRGTEASDLLHWLRACAEPSDEQLVRMALATNTLDLPLRQLAEWQEDELAWEQQMQLFMQFHLHWRHRGVLVMLHKLLEAFELPGRLLQKSRGERSLTNLLHLAEWLQQAATRLDGEQALIRHLAEHLDSTDEQQLLRLESDARRVKVITIHKSKGLEYPLVLLPFISGWRHIDGKQKQVPWWHESGQYIEASDNKIFPAAWEAANDQRISEDLRLLYVAVTRATHALWLGVAPLRSGNSNSPQLERSALGYLLNGGQKLSNSQAVQQALEELAQHSSNITLQDAPPATSNTYREAVTEQLEAARARPRLGQLNNWWIASYSALEYESQPLLIKTPTTSRDDYPEHSRDKTTAELLDENTETSSTEQDQLMHHFPAGSVWGTFLHSLLEWAAVQELRTPDKQRIRGFAAAALNDPLRDDQLLRRCKLRQIESFAQPLSDWLKSFLQQRWQTPGFALVDLQPSQIAVELEFLISSHSVDTRRLDQLVQQHTLQQADRPAVKANQLNGLLKGFIDLVVEHQGQYYVLDWKSNRLGTSDRDYSPQALQQAMLKKRYDLQYVIYLLALHRQLQARLPDYDYDRHMGGAIYVFLRGTHNPDSQGLFCDRPPRELIEQLDQLFRATEESLV